MWRLSMGWHDEKLVRIGLVGRSTRWMDLEGTTRCSPSTFCLLPPFNTEYSLKLLKHFQNGILLGVLASPIHYTISGKIDWICVSQMCSVLILPHLHLILFCFDKIPIDPGILYLWCPLTQTLSHLARCPMQSRRVVSTISYRPNNYSAVLSQPRWHCQWHPFIRPNCLKSKLQFVETQGLQKLALVFFRAFTVSRLAWDELCGQMKSTVPIWFTSTYFCVYMCTSWSKKKFS